MPKLPQVRDRELIRVLKKLGFFEHPERGTSHLVFAHSDVEEPPYRVTPARISLEVRCAQFSATSMSHHKNLSLPSKNSK